MDSQSVCCWFRMLSACPRMFAVIKVGLDSKVLREFRTAYSSFAMLTNSPSPTHASIFAGYAGYTSARNIRRSGWAYVVAFLE